MTMAEYADYLTVASFFILCFMLGLQLGDRS